MMSLPRKTGIILHVGNLFSYACKKFPSIHLKWPRTLPLCNKMFVWLLNTLLMIHFGKGLLCTKADTKVKNNCFHRIYSGLCSDSSTTSFFCLLPILVFWEELPLKIMLQWTLKTTSQKLKEHNSYCIVFLVQDMDFMVTIAYTQRHCCREQHDNRKCSSVSFPITIQYLLIVS